MPRLGSCCCATMASASASSKRATTVRTAGLAAKLSQVGLYLLDHKYERAFEVRNPSNNLLGSISPTFCSSVAKSSPIGSNSFAATTVRDARNNTASSCGWDELDGPGRGSGERKPGPPSTGRGMRSLSARKQHVRTASGFLVLPKMSSLGRAFESRTICSSFTFQRPCFSFFSG